MRPSHVILLFLAIFLWSGYYVAGPFVLEVLPPFFVTASRFALVAIALLPFVGWPKMPFMKILQVAVLLGVLNFGLGLAAMGWGLDVPTAIVLSQLTIPLSCVFGAVLLDDKLGPWRSAGLVVAMLGAVFIAGTPNVTSNYPAFIAMLVSAISWGWANILLKKYGEQRILPFWGAVSLLSCLPLFLVSFVVEDGQIAALKSLDLRGTASLLYLAFGSTLGAYSIWSYLLQRYPASQITPVTMLGPFVSFGLAWVFLDQAITGQVMIAGAITMVGVAIIVIRRPRLAVLGRFKLHKRPPQEG